MALWSAGAGRRAVFGQTGAEANLGRLGVSENSRVRGVAAHDAGETKIRGGTLRACGDLGSVDALGGLGAGAPEPGATSLGLLLQNPEPAPVGVGPFQVSRARKRSSTGWGFWIHASLSTIVCSRPTFHSWPFPRPSKQIGDSLIHLQSHTYLLKSSGVRLNARQPGVYAEMRA